MESRIQSRFSLYGLWGSSSNDIWLLVDSVRELFCTGTNCGLKLNPNNAATLQYGEVGHPTYGPWDKMGQRFTILHKARIWGTALRD